MEACRRQGIIQNELYYIDYKDYCNNHPEISKLPEDIKKYRYNLLENLRKKTINQIREERLSMINKTEETNKTCDTKEEDNNKNNVN